MNNLSPLDRMKNNKGFDTLVIFCVFEFLEVSLFGDM